jgi:hypothetical protein
VKVLTIMIERAVKEQTQIRMLKSILAAFVFESRIRFTKLLSLLGSRAKTTPRDKKPLLQEDAGIETVSTRLFSETTIQQYRNKGIGTLRHLYPHHTRK